MADGDGGGENIWQTFTGTKVGGIPLPALALVGVLGGAYLIVRQRRKADAAASNQQDANALAGDLADQQTPLMPFVGGDTFLTVTNPITPNVTVNVPPGQPAPPPPHAPPPPPPPHAPPPPPPPPPIVTTRTYVVRSGDTLWKIAGMYGSSIAKIYNANQGVIENTAKSHGFSSSSAGHPGNPGWWIFPGERLVIPN